MKHASDEFRAGYFPILASSSSEGAVEENDVLGKESAVSRHPRCLDDVGHQSGDPWSRNFVPGISDGRAPDAEMLGSRFSMSAEGAA
eukprot:16235502-Heterocapsa_arctica.AAC.1